MTVRSWNLLAPVLTLAASIAALARGYEVPAAIYLVVTLVDVAALASIVRRTWGWYADGRRGQARIAWSWGAVAACHWAAGYACYSADFIGGAIMLGTGLQPFLLAGTALTTVRYSTLVANALQPGERLLAFCHGAYGEPPRSGVLAATDRRIVAAIQPGLRTQLDEVGSVARADIVGVDLTDDAEGNARVAIRTAEHELTIGHVVPPMAETFVRHLEGEPVAS